MKKKLIAISIALIILFCFALPKVQTTHKMDLAFSNIEALAQIEDGDSYFCFGAGSLDCDGHKVSYIGPFLR